MNVESLENLLVALQQRPLQTLAILAALAVFAVVTWYVSAYVSEKAKQRVAKKQANAVLSNNQAPDSTGKPNTPEYTDYIPLTPQSLDLVFDVGSEARSLTMSDGTIARAHVQVVYRVNNPYKFTYSTEDHPLHVLLPLIFARVHQLLLESFSLPEARARRREAEGLLQQELDAEFERCGMIIESVNIGAMEGLRVS